MKRYCIIFALLSYYGFAFGQWNADSTKNTLVCNAPNQQMKPRICTDGSNGCFVVWTDTRHSGFGQIYIQKFNANGVAQWPANGIRVCSTQFQQRSPVVAADGNGGAYVVWQDDRNPNTKPDLYAQHINGDGSKAYGTWAQSIAKVAEANFDINGQKNISIIADGAGNAYVAWEDFRTTITPESSRPDIYMTRLYPGGVRDSGTGVPVLFGPSRQTEPYMIRDTLNRCFLAFSTNYPQPPYGIGGTPIDTNLDVLWGTNPVPNIVYRNTNYALNSFRPRAIKYAGMYYMAWEELQGTASAGWDVLAQKLSNTGTRAWFLPATMSPSLVGDQLKPIPNTDYAGGMQVVFEDYQASKSISSSRVLSNGSTLKPPSPNYIYTICNLSGDQRNPMAVQTEKGMLVFWEDGRKSAGDTTGIYAQVIDTTPMRYYSDANTVKPGSRWGFAVSTDAGPNHSNKDQMDIAPRDNGAIVVWRDGRNYSNSNYDIYMQIVFKNATLPIELADFQLSNQLENAVRIDWQTAMEKNNAGFEIERRLTSQASDEDIAYEVIASYKNLRSLAGVNTSSTTRTYSYLDLPPAFGRYEYRLVDYSLDGERTTHSSREIEVGSESAHDAWSVLAPSPNPFRDRTTISFITPQRATVDLQVIDQLGRVVASQCRNAVLGSGPHTVAINAVELGASGTYYYILSARDAETGNVVFTTKPTVLNCIR